MTVLQCKWKDDNAWVKKCMDYEIESVDARCRRNRTWNEAVEAEMRYFEDVEKGRCFGSQHIDETDNRYWVFSVDSLVTMSDCSSPPVCPEKRTVLTVLVKTFHHF